MNKLRNMIVGGIRSRLQARSDFTDDTRLNEFQIRHIFESQQDIKITLPSKAYYYFGTGGMARGFVRYQHHSMEGDILTQSAFNIATAISYVLDLQNKGTIFVSDFTDDQQARETKVKQIFNVWGS